MASFIHTKEDLCGFLPKVLLARGAIWDFEEVVNEGRRLFGIVRLKL